MHSYSEVHHAIQPAFRDHTPYLILLVDLDTQKGEPTADEALRVVGNLRTPDGQLAPPEMVRRVGIGTRVRMVFSDVGPGLALPQWTIDDAAPQPAQGLALSAGVAARGGRAARATYPTEPDPIRQHGLRVSQAAAQPLTPPIVRPAVMRRRNSSRPRPAASHR